jgi:hypothetical protein
VTDTSVKPAGPDKESDTVTDAVTATSLWFGGQSTLGLTLQVTVGGVLSMFTRGDVKVALLPAASVTVTLCAIPWPSPVNSTGLGRLVTATPERLSEVVKGIDTLVLFHPAALGAGAGTPNVSVGGVLSIFTGGDA